MQILWILRRGWGRYTGRVHRVQVLDFKGLTDEMTVGLSDRMLMEHKDAQGQSLFTSRSWRRLLEVRGLLVHEHILEFFSTFRFGKAVLGLDTVGALQFQLEEIESTRFGAYLAESSRQMGSECLLDYIARRSQAPEKICDQIDDTWAWVAPGPERQPNATAGALKVVGGAPIVDEGASAVPTSVQAFQPPPAARPSRTLPQRVARLEEEVHGMREALGKQREILDSMAHDFSWFTTRTVTSLSLMMDKSEVTYTRYFESLREYQRRRVRRRTDEPSTSTLQ
ncbi:hypothetical protein Tco_0849544 [Tanacetum coccineum]